MQGGRQGRWEPAAHGREQAAWGQHRTGAGGVSVLLPGRTGGRKGGAEGRRRPGLLREEKTGGGAYIGGDGEFLTCAT